MTFLSGSLVAAVSAGDAVIEVAHVHMHLGQVRARSSEQVSTSGYHNRHTNLSVWSERKAPFALRAINQEADSLAT